MKFGNEIKTWNENESPFKLYIDILKQLGTPNQTIGIEVRYRLFLYDGIKKENQN